MKIDYLEFKDGVRVYYVNNDRKNHFVISEEYELRINYSMSNIEMSSRKVRVNYKQWKHRWAL